MSKTTLKKTAKLKGNRVRLLIDNKTITFIDGKYVGEISKEQLLNIKKSDLVEVINDTESKTTKLKEE